MYLLLTSGYNTALIYKQEYSVTICYILFLRCCFNYFIYMFFVLQMHIEEPLFDILRTKEQLGYSVHCTVRDTFGILGYSITVNTQAIKNSTHSVDSRIEAFIKHMDKLLKKFSEKKLNQIKRDLIKVKRCADVDLDEEVGRNWAEIVNQDFVFDREEKEVEAIEKLKVIDIKKFWEEHNVFGNKNKFKKLTVQV